MCGIAGYIGKPKKPKVSYEIITALLEYLEMRGTDATGLWGTECGGRERVFYHKEPVTSSTFVQMEFWKSLRRVQFDTLLLHARAASKGATHAFQNVNNHPFTSTDYRIGLVHNGCIDEAKFLRNKYETYSDTDSEFLLRMYEHEFVENPTENTQGLGSLVGKLPSKIVRRLGGLKEIWSVVDQGAMAVVIGERISEDEKLVFMFRNNKRPLWLIDFREELGQIFYFSSPEIWYSAIRGNDRLKKLVWSRHKLVELPISEIWVFHVTKEDPIVSDANFHRIDVSVSDTSSVWSCDGLLAAPEACVNLEVSTMLDEYDNVVRKRQEFTTFAEDADPSKEAKAQPFYAKSEFPENELQEIPNGSEHIKCHSDILSCLNSISTEIYNRTMEKSMQVEDYHDLCQSLKQAKYEMEVLLWMLRKKWDENMEWSQIPNGEDLCNLCDEIRSISGEIVNEFEAVANLIDTDSQNEYNEAVTTFNCCKIELHNTMFILRI